MSMTIEEMIKNSRNILQQEKHVSLRSVFRH